MSSGPPAPREVAFFFDFVSPYSWLALVQAEEFAAAHGVAWNLYPIVYGAVLEARGLLGPAETREKRNYTFADVARCAARIGVTFTGPPVHPFRSLDALRVMTLFRDDPRALVLARELASAAWSGCRDLADARVLADVARAAGFDVAGPGASGLEGRIAAREVKAALRENTALALAGGVFGVPSFIWNEELFWGHDRLSHLADRLSGRLPDTRAAADRALARPLGVVRAAALKPKEVLP